MKYNIEVWLPNDGELTFTGIEADNEEEAIRQVSKKDDKFVIFETDSTYFKINESKIIGYKVYSQINSDSEDDGPMKRAIN